MAAGSAINVLAGEIRLIGGSPPVGLRLQDLSELTEKELSEISQL
jgi:hypothetical protein